MEQELTQLLRQLQHCIETPGDFTADETTWLLADLARTLEGAPAETVVTPIVHLNGTSREELIHQRVELHHALREAEAKLGAASPNARDYYVQPGLWHKALAQHERRLRVLGDLRAQVEVEIREVDEA